MKSVHGALMNPLRAGTIRHLPKKSQLATWVNNSSLALVTGLRVDP